MIVPVPVSDADKCYLNRKKRRRPGLSLLATDKQKRENHNGVHMRSEKESAHSNIYYSSTVLLQCNRTGHPFQESQLNRDIDTVTLSLLLQ